MIDVHPPQHGIHGVRDFFIHLLTITVGLLIALGLENAAEAVHHRHQREEADQTIRAELNQNREQLKESQAQVANEMQNMVKALEYLQQRVQGKQASPAGLSLGFSMVYLQTSAWRTAGTTGVMQYMDYAQAQKLAAAYDSQELFNQLQTQTLDSYMRLISYMAADKDPASLNQDEMRSAMADVRSTLAHLGAMRDVSRGLAQTYDQALK